MANYVLSICLALVVTTAYADICPAYRLQTVVDSERIHYTDVEFCIIVLDMYDCEHSGTIRFRQYMCSKDVYIVANFNPMPIKQVQYYYRGGLIFTLTMPTEDPIGCIVIDVDNLFK